MKMLGLNKTTYFFFPFLTSPETITAAGGAMTIGSLIFKYYYTLPIIWS